MELNHWHTLTFVLDDGADSTQFHVDDEGLKQVRNVLKKYRETRRQLENAEKMLSERVD